MLPRIKLHFHFVVKYKLDVLCVLGVKLEKKKGIGERERCSDHRWSDLASTLQVAANPSHTEILFAQCCLKMNT